MDKFYINRNRKPLTPDDVKKGQDFDAFMKAYSARPAAGKSFWGSGKMYLSFVAGGVVATLGTWVILNNSGADPKDDQKITHVIPKADDPQLKDTTYVVDASTGADLFYRTGSLIHVPANAFVDSAGHAITGNVQIYYREFHDTAVVAHAGIPLCTDSTGRNAVQVSAGLLAISAWQNGKPLFVNASNMIHVAMADEQPVQNCHISTLSASTRMWTADHDAMSVLAGFVADTAKHAEVVTKDPVMPLKPAKADKSKHSFVIAFDPMEFPELAMYKGVRFEVDETKTPYNRSDRNIQWEDVSIARNADHKSYSVTFTKGNQKSTYVSGVVVDDANYDAAMKIYDQKYAAYLLAVKQKEDAANAAPQMNADASRIFTNDSLLNRSMSLRNSGTENGNIVMCEFIISSFGIWNADHSVVVP